MYRVLCITALALFSLAPLPALAADLLVPHDVSSGSSNEADHEIGNDAYIRDFATLTLLRSRYQVIMTEQVPEVVADEIVRVRLYGSSAGDIALLRRDLMAEASYHIVSLRYLILSGGAFWPSDGSGRSFEQEALAKLDAAQNSIFSRLDAGESLVPALSDVALVHSWTEGLTTVPDELDFAARLEALLAAATPLAQSGTGT